MKKLLMLALLISTSFFTYTTAQAQCSGHSNAKAKAVKVNNSASGQDVVDIAISSPDHTTLVAAVKAAGLVGTLKSEGPFTVFAPTNAAFAKLPDGTVETLLKPKNKAKLTQVLTYHVVAGNFTASDVVGAIKANGGQATFDTVSGGKLRASLSGDTVILEDENGGRAAVTAVDLKGSNGVIHVIDSVVLPK